MSTITKPVWQLDIDGYLLGQTIADECQLEPGAWLVPAGCVEVEPPDNLPAKHEWRWVQEAWLAVAMREPVITPSAATKLQAFLQANPDVKALIDG